MGIVGKSSICKTMRIFTVGKVRIHEDSCVEFYSTCTDSSVHCSKRGKSDSIAHDRVGLLVCSYTDMKTLDI